MSTRTEDAIERARFDADEGERDPALLVAEIDRLRARVKLLESREVDYESVLGDVRKIARHMDVAMHGEEGAAQQPALCDVAHSVEDMARKNAMLKAALAPFATVRDKTPLYIIPNQPDCYLTAQFPAEVWQRAKDALT